LARRHKGYGQALSPSAFPIGSPDSVSRFLATKGTTLLLKGYAGSGKTTLALQLLSQLSKGGKGAYISSRVSKSKLLQQLPWLEGFERKTKEKTEFIDVRLVTAESILEEVLKIVVSRPRDTGVKTIVLDTWDGLAKEMEDKERLKAEKTLIALADSTKARMIFVSEEPGRTTMDYLVDGIIELVRAEEYNRVFREVEIQKLRGTLISQHKYLYTLLGGVFRHFEPYSPPGRAEGKWFKPMEDHDGAFSFGSPVMDREFGGLGKGDTSVFEYVENVPYSALRLIELPAIVNALNLGHGVLCVPLPGTGVENLAAVIRSATSEDEVRERLVITTQGDPIALKPPFYGIGSMVPEESGQRLIKLIEGVRGRSKRDGVLVVGSVGMLEGAYASNLNPLLEQISHLISDIQVRSIDALMLFMPANSQLKARLIAMSREHARFFVKDRSVVFMGEKPNTEAMVFEHSPENPALPCLTKIV
jgi:KaiC/GvpD/RAD55 family RecA-like ATPase